MKRLNAEPQGAQAEPADNSVTSGGADAEVICTWMQGFDPRAPQSFRFNIDNLTWWGARFDAGEWEYFTRTLTLDALWEVEEQLIQEGHGDRYRKFLVHQDCYFWHATAEQKIMALASVLRSMPLGTESASPSATTTDSPHLTPSSSRENL